MPKYEGPIEPRSRAAWNWPYANGSVSWFEDERLNCWAKRNQVRRRPSRAAPASRRLPGAGSNYSGLAGWPGWGLGSR